MKDRVSIHVDEVVKVLGVWRRHHVAALVGVGEGVEKGTQTALSLLHEGALGRLQTRAAQNAVVENVKDKQYVTYGYTHFVRLCNKRRMKHCHLICAVRTIKSSRNNATGRVFPLFRNFASKCPVQYLKMSRTIPKKVFGVFFSSCEFTIQACYFFSSFPVLPKKIILAESGSSMSGFSL